MRFNFCITTGVDGYLPDNQNYVEADNSIDAFDAIKDALREFKDYEDCTVNEANWETFFERGCRAPDASMWNFTLAMSENGPSLSLVGMTQAEFDRQSAE